MYQGKSRISMRCTRIRELKRYVLVHLHPISCGSTNRYFRPWRKVFSQRRLFLSSSGERLSLSTILFGKVLLWSLLPGSNPLSNGVTEEVRPGTPLESVTVPLYVFSPPGSELKPKGWRFLASMSQVHLLALNHGIWVSHPLRPSRRSWSRQG